MTIAQLAIRIAMAPDRVKSAMEGHRIAMDPASDRVKLAMAGHRRYPACGMPIGEFIIAAFAPDASILVNWMDFDIVHSTKEAARAEAIDDRW